MKNFSQMRFDMDEIHGTKVIDHRKANIRRYVDVHLTRRPDVPGHMVVDTANSHLYISDTGANRILRVKTTSGQFHRGAMCNNHTCYRHENHFWTCGIKRDDDRVKFVNETMCQSSNDCKDSPTSCFRDIDNICPPEDGGWCHHGECKGDDGFGCYTTMTGMILDNDNMLHNNGSMLHTNECWYTTMNCSSSTIETESMCYTINLLHVS